MFTAPPGTSRSEHTDRQENVIALGNSGAGRTHIALGLEPGGVPEKPHRPLPDRSPTGP